MVNLIYTQHFISSWLWIFVEGTKRGRVYYWTILLVAQSNPFSIHDVSPGSYNVTRLDYTVCLYDACEQRQRKKAWQGVNQSCGICDNSLRRIP